MAVRDDEARGRAHGTRRIVDVVHDAQNRRALWERLQYALDGEPDPWFEFDKARVDVRQFVPVKEL